MVFFYINNSSISCFIKDKIHIVSSIKCGGLHLFLASTHHHFATRWSTISLYTCKKKKKNLTVQHFSQQILVFLSWIYLYQQIRPLLKVLKSLQSITMSLEPIIKRKHIGSRINIQTLEGCNATQRVGIGLYGT